MPSRYPLMTAHEAASLITHNQTLACSGFTAAGSVKVVTRALAERANAEHAAGRPFKINLLTGASTGDSCDGVLARAEAIALRSPYMSNPELRKQINAGQVQFFDMHLSMIPQQIRYGFLGPIHWAIVEAADVTADGDVLLTSSVGASNTFLHRADRIIIELNSRHPAKLRGFHDLWEPADPPFRKALPIFQVRDRAGQEVCRVDPSRIAGVVLTNLDDETPTPAAPTEVTSRIGRNIAEFLVAELKAGRLPSQFLPLQSGVGDVANSVLAALAAHPEIPDFSMYTEVLQDAAVPLLESGRMQFASTSALTLTPAMLQRLYGNLEFFRQRMVLRPQEISNHPEIVRRLGIISMNTAIEFDLFGNVNSTHVLGRQLMNGIGGSGDFTRNAYLSIFSCPSTQKNGAVSTVVPLVTHVDQNEHSVQVVVTEHGVADLRGKGPRQRAHEIIDRCAAPQYRDQLKAYLSMAPPGHMPFSTKHVFAMHEKFEADGDMRGARFD